MSDVINDSTGAAPLGTEVASSGSSNNAVPAATPTPIDLSDDTLIKVKGSDKPVAFKDHIRGFQSQFTKASQRAAQLEKQLQEREARIQQFEREKATSEQASRGPANDDPLAMLEQLPYLSGKDAKMVVQQIQGAIQQRDQVLLAALKQMQKMQSVLGSLNENHSMSAFDGRISKWLADGGYPPEAADLAKEIYLAYEGDDLNEEFPRIFSERWNQVEKLMEARRAGKIAAARKTPFIPGKGGAAGPSKPLQLDPRSSPRQVAESLWDSIQTGDET